MISGTDLYAALGAEETEHLHWLLAERGVVIFTDQKLDPAGH